MDYEKRYTEALERARELSKTVTGANYEYIFPELVESEDERIRKAIISGMIALKNNQNIKTFAAIPINDCIAWLEEQGKPTHVELGQSEVTKTSDQELEPKFKVGDCVISNDGTHTYIVKERKRGTYVILDIGEDEEFSIVIETADRTGRLWTIQDAKDGDVLVTTHDNGQGLIIFIFKRVNDAEMFCHCLYDSDMSDKLCFDACRDSDFIGGVSGAEEEFSPATKEQRDLLFHKMKEAGYEWDSKNKELKKIESKKLDPDKVIA